jgi:hypothetical protein
MYRWYGGGRSFERSWRSLRYRPDRLQVEERVARRARPQSAPIENTPTGDELASWRLDTQVLAGGETMRLCSAPLAYYCRQSVVTRNDGTGPVILKFRAGPQQNVRIDSNHRYQFSRRITPLPTPGGTCTMSKSSSIARSESSSARGFCNTFTDSVAAAWSR